MKRGDGVVDGVWKVVEEEERERNEEREREGERE